MDNRYYNYKCPPLMQDARFITNYTPSRIFEQQIRGVNNIDSAQDYKIFLQTNGETIMTRERAYLEATNTCSVDGKCVKLSSLEKEADDCDCNCKR